MCRRRFVFEQYPIALPCSPERPDTCESISAIGCPLPLRSSRALDQKKSPGQASARRCKCCRWQIADHPSNAGSRKPKSAGLFATQNVQSLQVRLSFAASKVLGHEFDLRIEPNPVVAPFFHERKCNLATGRTQTA